MPSLAGATGGCAFMTSPLSTVKGVAVQLLPGPLQYQILPCASQSSPVQDLPSLILWLQHLTEAPAPSLFCDLNIPSFDLSPGTFTSAFPSA